MPIRVGTVFYGHDSFSLPLGIMDWEYVVPVKDFRGSLIKILRDDERGVACGLLDRSIRVQVPAGIQSLSPHVCGGDGSPIKVLGDDVSAGTLLDLCSHGISLKLNIGVRKPRLSLSRLPTDQDTAVGIYKCSRAGAYCVVRAKNRTGYLCVHCYL